MKIATGVEMLELRSTASGKLMHPTLIWDNKNTVLVDTAYPGQVSEFRQGIMRAGALFENIDKIVITHRDWDHTGGLVDILADLPQKPLVLAHVEEKTYIDEFITPLECIVVEDGEQLPFCGGIKIIHTPGHKPGHISLYLQQSKALIAADALAVENDELVLPPKFVNDYWRLALRSLHKLIKYDIETVICYHGGLWRGNLSKSIEELSACLDRE